jgi:hypothetical protein
MIEFDGKEYRLYKNNEFLLRSIEELERDVQLEMKYFNEKEVILERLKNTNITLQELENVIEEINDNNKNKINYFLISKEEDEENSY